MASEARPILPALVDVLRSTLLHLEQIEGLGPDDPALLEVKSQVVRAIAEVEIMRTTNAAQKTNKNHFPSPVRIDSPHPRN